MKAIDLEEQEREAIEKHKKNIEFERHLLAQINYNMIYQGYNGRNCLPTRTIKKIYLYGISSLSNFKLFW